MERGKVSPAPKGTQYPRRSWGIPIVQSLRCDLGAYGGSWQGVRWGLAWVGSWAPGEAAGGMERRWRTSQAGQGEDSPTKPLAVTRGTQIPVLPKWGTGPRPGAVPRCAGDPSSPSQPARSPTFWFLGPPPRLGPLAWPLVRAASLPTRHRRPSPGGRCCVLTCEASLSEALSVQISRGLLPAVGARLTGPRLPALSRLPRAPTQPACTPGHPPTTERQGCSLPARQPGLLLGPPTLTWPGADHTPGPSAQPDSGGPELKARRLGLPQSLGPDVKRAVGGPGAGTTAGRPPCPARWLACHSGRENRL